MKRAPDITRDEWLGLLESLAEKQGDEGMSVREIAAILGLDPDCSCHLTKTRTFVRQQMKAGVVSSGTGRRLSMDGRMMRVPVYRMVRGE